MGERKEWHRFKKANRAGSIITSLSSAGKLDGYAGLEKTNVLKILDEVKHQAIEKEIEILNAAAPASLSDRSYPKIFTVKKKDAAE